MLLIDRIKEIIAQHELSSTAFADRLGVQRSSISHILSGRNKPSLDFIMKLLQAFPTTDTNWLLFGTESNSPLPINTPSPLPPLKEDLAIPDKRIEDVISSDLLAEPTTKDTLNPSKISVKQVVVLYSDGSCSTYTNKK